VLAHQVTHHVTTFDALLRNNVYHFLQCCVSSFNFFIQSLQISDAYYKSSFFVNCLTLMHDGDQLIQLLMRCTSVWISSVLFLH